MGAGGLSFVWLCPLLTPVLIFGLDTLQQAAGGTLSLTGGAVYGLMSLLFCVAVLPWIVAWMIKERLTS
jgi:ABC-type transport system involved in cytochrome c biogenesis permease component